MPDLLSAGLVQDSSGLQLLERIGREILLYEQFLDMGSNLNLDAIMRGPIEDIDEVQSILLSSEGSFSNAWSFTNRRVSISSSQFFLPRSQAPSNNLSSFHSSDSLAHLQDDAVVSVPPGPQDYLKWTRLRKLSLSLFSEAFERQVGFPTAFTVADGIAVGTSKAVVLLYDFRQNLLGILGDPSPSQASTLGPVISLGISIDQKSLFAGHSRGGIVIWDIHRRTAIKQILPVTSAEQQSGKRDGHTTGSAIVSVASLSKTSFVSADDQGTAFYHSFSRGIMMTTVKSTRIHGRPIDATSTNQTLPTTIFAIAALPPLPVKHPIDDYRLVAIATPYKMAIMSMKPLPQIQFRIPWDLGDGTPSSSESAPKKPVSIACLDWLPYHNQSQDYGDPRLAFSHRNQISILQVTTTTVNGDRSKVKIDYIVKGQGRLKENINAVRWINEELVTLSSSTFELLETTDISSFSIVRYPLFNKPLQMFNMSVDPAFSNSICVFKGRVLLLTKSEIPIAGLISWTDRIASLIRVGNFKEAFQMASGFYRMENKFAVAGLPRNAPARQSRISEHVSSLILSYVSMCLSGYDPLADEDLTVYRQATETIFETSLAISRADLLFGEVFDRFNEAHLSTVFLDTLEPYILSEQIRAISNPSVIQSLIAHCVQLDVLDRLEQMLLHLDPSAFDIHHILRLCKQYSLFNALVYVYNTALGDFITPLFELLAICSISISTSSESRGSLETNDRILSSIVERQQNGIYILFVYLAYILTGQAFPIGSLDPSDAQKAQSDIYTVLLSKTHVQHLGTASASLGTAPFPYMRMLVVLDVREFIKMLGTVLEDSVLNTGIPYSSVIDSTPLQRVPAPLITRQTVIDVLIEIIASLADLQSTVSHDPTTISLYAFIARCYGKYRQYLRLADSLIETIVTALCTTVDDASRSEREISILAIFAGGNCPFSSLSKLTAIEMLALLEQYEAAGLWRVYEFGARMMGKYGLVLRAFLKDERRVHETLSAIHALLESGSLTYQQSIDVKRSVLDYIHPLTELDGVATARLISSYWPTEHDHILELLADSPWLVYMYLKGLISSDVHVSNSVSVVVPPPTLVVTSQRSASLSPTRSKRHSAQPASSPSLSYPTAYFDRFIELMAEYDPAKVYPYLVWLNETMQNGFPYTVEHVIVVLRQHNIADATAWILERTGDYPGALATLLANMLTIANRILETTTSASYSSPRSISPSSQLEADTTKAADGKQYRASMLAMLESCIGLCERSTAVLDEKDQKDLWFMLLTRIYFELPQLHAQHDRSMPHPDGLQNKVAAVHMAVSPRSPVHLQEHSSNSDVKHGVAIDIDASTSAKFFNDLARLVMNAVVGHVPLPSIIYHVVQSQKGATFADHRDMIFSMLDSHVYQRELYQAATHITNDDSFKLLATVIETHRHGLRPIRGQCEQCHRLLHVRAMFEHEHEQSLVVFACRHAFHRLCLEIEMEAFASKAGIDFIADYGLWCTVCGKNRREFKRHRKGKAKAILKSQIELFHRLQPVATGFEDLEDIINMNNQ
eukprot:jgi/Hompol1/282/HPOL_000397-RA